MHIRRRFMSFICAGFLTSAALYGCGSSTTTETVPSTVTVFKSHSIIFRNNSAMTMGYNQFGQLGDDTLDNKAVATLVPGLGHLTKGAVGGAHTLAFSNHTSVVMAWGSNAFGQLGDPLVSTTAGTAFSPTPKSAQLEGLVTDVAAGGYHSLAVAGGSVWGWGYNGNGQVGADTATTNTNIAPLKLTKDNDGALLPPTAVQVAAGGLHSLALFDDGPATSSVYGWGSNAFGQLGFHPYSAVGYTKPKKVRLTEVTGKVEQIGAGDNFSLALEVVRDGLGNITGQTLWAWGYGPVGQLGTDPSSLDKLQAGNINTAFSFAPRKMFSQPVVGPGTLVIKKFSAGFDHVLLLLGARDSIDGSDGSWTIKAVGLNFYGQLGNNSTAISSFELVNTLNSNSAPAAPAPLTGATDIAAFGNHSLALVGGIWYGWGNNNFGQLGSPVSASSASNPRRPVRLDGF